MATVEQECRVAYLTIKSLFTEDPLSYLECKIIRDAVLKAKDRQQKVKALPWEEAVSAYLLDYGINFQDHATQVLIASHPREFKEYFTRLRQSMM